MFFNKIVGTTVPLSPTDVDGDEWYEVNNQCLCSVGGQQKIVVCAPPLTSWISVVGVQCEQDGTEHTALEGLWCSLLVEEDWQSVPSGFCLWERPDGIFSASIGPQGKLVRVQVEVTCDVQEKHFTSMWQSSNWSSYGQLETWWGPTACSLNRIFLTSAVDADTGRASGGRVHFFRWLLIEEIKERIKALSSSFNMASHMMVELVCHISPLLMLTSRWFLLVSPLCLLDTI